MLRKFNSSILAHIHGAENQFNIIINNSRVLNQINRQMTLFIIIFD